MKSLLKIFNLYWFGTLLGIASYVVTRGKDGHLMLFFILFSALAILYLIAMPLCFNTKFTIHSVGHLVFFELICIAAYMINPNLDEMAGALYYMIPVAVFGVVLLGSASLFLISFLKK